MLHFVQHDGGGGRMISVQHNDLKRGATMTEGVVTEADKDFLESVCRGAGEILCRFFGTKLTSTAKSDKSIVTEADLASEKYILEQIKRFYPDDLFLAEESGLSHEAPEPGKYIWIIDPLDGTTNFFNAYPFFSVSIARALVTPERKYEVVLGGVGDPCRNQYYWAAQGMGAYRGSDKLQVSGSTDIDAAFIVTGIAYNRNETFERDQRILMRVLERCRNLRRDGSAALDMALVACGVFEAFFEAGLKPWDVAAGSILIKEAGGVIHNYDATQAYDVAGEGVICGGSHVVSFLQSQLWGVL
jgi:myo-inositol-1(or 4)-monophosphatase